MLWVGQFGIADGEAREHSPWVGAFPAPAPGEAAADLYLVVEPALPGSEEFCAELVAAIGSVFLQKRLSLSGGLLRALRAAHENLREWNRKSLREHRVAAGVSCLALRPGSGQALRPGSDRAPEQDTETDGAGHEAYLAQVAPAAAALYREGVIHILEPDLPDAAEPLGMNEEFWPDFSRWELAAGDRLLLLSPSLARGLPPQELAAALSLAPQDALPTLYRQARSVPNCGALLVAALAEGPAA
ncbi:MAG TPA: hypothetical protein VFT91_04635 [Dehalococcoidia bacterium]|nr:hypothetical protein [Dehalococcoidia bacterium]